MSAFKGIKVRTTMSVSGKLSKNVIMVPKLDL